MIFLGMRIQMYQPGWRAVGNAVDSCPPGRDLNVKRTRTGPSTGAGSSAPRSGSCPTGCRAALDSTPPLVYPACCRSPFFYRPETRVYQCVSVLYGNYLITWLKNLVTFRHSKRSFRAPRIYIDNNLRAFGKNTVQLRSHSLNIILLLQ